MEVNPEAFVEMQAIRVADYREQSGLILEGKKEILRKVIDASLAEETKPKDRLVFS